MSPLLPPSVARGLARVRFRLAERLADVPLLFFAVVGAVAMIFRVALAPAGPSPPAGGDAVRSLAVEPSSGLAGMTSGRAAAGTKATTEPATAPPSPPTVRDPVLMPRSSSPRPRHGRR